MFAEKRNKEAIDKIKKRTLAEKAAKETRLDRAAKLEQGKEKYTARRRYKEISNKEDTQMAMEGFRKA